MMLLKKMYKMLKILIKNAENKVPDNTNLAANT